MPKATIEAFRALHESGCFVMPNPWNPGTARWLGSLGFPALATTSSGFSFSRALPDMDWAVPRDLVLAHVADIVSATDLPVNADFESGYAHDPEGVATNVSLCLTMGAAGLSIEDATGDRQKPLYDVARAAERIRAARAAIDLSGSKALLTGRAECFLVGSENPLADSIRRLEAYADAGADVLFAPGLKTQDEIVAVVKAVAPKPVNVLMSAPGAFGVADLAEWGVRRISVGSALARAAWGGFVKAAEALKEGSFDGFADAAPFAMLNGFFRNDFGRRNNP